MTCHVSWLLVRNARSCFVLLLANAPIALTSRGLWIGRCFNCYLWSVGILRRSSSLLASCQWKCVVSCCVSSQLRLALIDRTPRFGMRRTVKIQEGLNAVTFDFMQSASLRKTHAVSDYTLLPLSSHLPCTSLRSENIDLKVLGGQCEWEYDWE